MNNLYKTSDEMSATEKIQAVNNIKNDLENNFVILGQLLSEIKKAKLFRYKGYKNFTEFVENEFNLSGSLAGKVIGAYDVFIKKLDVDETSVKQIGLDKLTMIKPLVLDLDRVESEEWIKKAETVSASELREEIREVKQKKRVRKHWPEHYMNMENFILRKKTMIKLFLTQKSHCKSMIV